MRSESGMVSVTSGVLTSAVFDVMVQYFSLPEIREKALRSPASVENEFKKLSQSEPLFVRSLETTTKATEATVARLGMWGAALQRRLKLRLRFPRLEEEIKFESNLNASAPVCH